LVGCHPLSFKKPAARRAAHFPLHIISDATGRWGGAGPAARDDRKLTEIKSAAANTANLQLNSLAGCIVATPLSRKPDHRAFARDYRNQAKARF
jgi:hypothetical protein